MKNRSSLAIFTTILSVLVSFTLLPQIQAAPQVAPPPDGAIPGSRQRKDATPFSSSELALETQELVGIRYF
jgi:hypothetical protein